MQQYHHLIIFSSYFYIITRNAADLIFTQPEPTPPFGLGHYRSIAQLLSWDMHSAVVVSSTHEPIFKIFFSAQVPTSTTATLEYPALWCWQCLPISVLATPERRYFFPILSNKNSQQSVVVFLRDKLGDNLKSRSSPRQCERGWGVERELGAGSNGLPQLL